MTWSSTVTRRLDTTVPWYSPAQIRNAFLKRPVVKDLIIEFPRPFLAQVYIVDVDGAEYTLAMERLQNRWWLFQVTAQRRRACRD